MRFVAGRGAVAKHLVRGAAVAERHQENAGQGTVAKRLAALWRIAIRKMLPAGRCSVAERHREDTARREMCQGEASGRRCPQGAALGSSIGKQYLEATPPRKAAGKGAAAGFDF